MSQTRAPADPMARVLASARAFARKRAHMHERAIHCGPERPTLLELASQAHTATLKSDHKLRIDADRLLAGPAKARIGRGERGLHRHSSHGNDGQSRASCWPGACVQLCALVCLRMQPFRATLTDRSYTKVQWQPAWQLGKCALNCARPTPSAA